MRMLDIIEKKKTGAELLPEEIKFLVNGFTKGEIPDYQMSAFLMAVYFKGMTDDETAKLTRYMAMSGDMADLGDIDGIKADKHSTGGVGDKTSFVVAPIVAACKIKMAKMSGRGLGHTGGTIDKLESIPGIKTTLTADEFKKQINKIGIAIVGQSGNLAPADKKIYALRDVTATVDSIPLIASSIMSKKLAAGADVILLDVKTGSGAFMQTTEDSIRLAEEMVKIGENNGRTTAAVVTDMDSPLGCAVGNSLELIEAADTLKEKGPSDFTELCMELSSRILFLCGKGSLDECRKLAYEAVKSGAALEKFCQMIEEQGGSKEYIIDTNKLPKAEKIIYVKAAQSGYISHIDTHKVGIASMLTGAGRATKDSKIDYSAGIKLLKKTSDYVAAGEVMAEIYFNNDSEIKQSAAILESAFTISAENHSKNKLIKAYVDKNGVLFL